MEIHIISHPEFFTNEVNFVSNILHQFDVYFHLRKPNASNQEIEAFITTLPKILHRKIILHSNYQLIEKYQLGGLHFSTSKRGLAQNYDDGIIKGTSCHSLSEIDEVQNDYDYCFLSPIFESISKKGYSGNLNLNDIASKLPEFKNIQVIALGGINDEKIALLQATGFDAYAVLGYLWNSNLNHQALEQKTYKLVQNNERPFCLSIAGFDPSGGAGVLADIKTFEANHCQGLGVTSAITYQNDYKFYDVNWLGINEIKKQIQPLIEYPVKAIKIGLIQNIDILRQLLDYLKEIFPSAKFVWDPVLKSSSGFEFHDDTNLPEHLNNSFDLITPNLEEYQQLSEFFKQQAKAYLLKGGHSKKNKGDDELIIDCESIKLVGTTFQKGLDKHGTGCVLSSAITSNLAKGNSIKASCIKGKSYVEQFIQSNTTNLGYHI